MADNLDQIVESSQAECLATGFEFTEGPLWHPEGYLLFVNNRRNLIYRLVPGGQPEIIREDSGSPGAIDPALRRLEQRGLIEGLADRTKSLRSREEFRPTTAERGRF